MPRRIASPMAGSAANTPRASSPPAGKPPRNPGQIGGSRQIASPPKSIVRGSPHRRCARCAPRRRPATHSIPTPASLRRLRASPRLARARASMRCPPRMRTQTRIGRDRLHRRAPLRIRASGRQAVGAPHRPARRHTHRRLRPASARGAWRAAMRAADGAPPHARRIRSDVGRHRLVVPPATRAANAVMLLTIRCQQTPRTLRCRRAATRAWHNEFPAHQCTRSLQ